ncbi:MAG: hypothetical protein RLY93_20570 [Sumerlaeia bacterium]
MAKRNKAALNPTEQEATLLRDHKTALLGAGTDEVLLIAYDEGGGAFPGRERRRKAMTEEERDETRRKAWEEIIEAHRKAGLVQDS